MKADDARQALEDATPLLIETLQLHWSTGQGTRVRHILWSLYTCSHLVNLGDACSGLDTRLAAAVHAAVTARLAVGPDCEKQLGHILRTSGEFARFDHAEKLTPDHLPVLYPPNSADSNELRRLADSADFVAENHNRGQMPQRDHATAEHRPANNPEAGQSPLPPGTRIRM